MKFIDIPIGENFTMKWGLLWRKVGETKAVDVWSNRLVQISPEVNCCLLKSEKL